MAIIIMSEFDFSLERFYKIDLKNPKVVVSETFLTGIRFRSLNENREVV
jgi:hypothetical protein